MSRAAEPSVLAGGKRDLAKAVLTFVTRPAFLAIVAVVLAIALAAVAVVVAMPEAEKGGARAVAASVPAPSAFYDLPALTADLKTSGRKSHLVQLSAMIEIPADDEAKLREHQPQIIADIQTCLRDMEREDLSGSAGTERLRGLVLSIVDRHIAPASARGVLFTRLLVD